MKIDQTDYAAWTDVAGLRVFVHAKKENVYPESVSFTITPGTDTALVVSRVGSGAMTVVNMTQKCHLQTETKRLGQPYGECNEDKTKVPSFYYDGPYAKEVSHIYFKNVHFFNLQIHPM